MNVNNDARRRHGLGRSLSLDELTPEDRFKILRQQVRDKLDKHRVNRGGAK